MRRTWFAAGLLVLTATAGPLPGHATPPGTLAGDTTITATSSGQADLTLAGDAVLDLAFADDQTVSTHWERRDFRLRGDGRYIAFVLRPAGDPEPILAGVRSGFCHTAGCPQVNTGHFELVTPFDQSGDQMTIPAGDYVATIVTDGAPVTVQLILSGVGGTSTVDATRTVDVPRWHPGFTRVGPEQVVFDQQTLTAPPDSLVLAGWAFMEDSADVVRTTVGWGCQHPGAAIDPLGDYTGCAVGGYATNLFSTRNHGPGVTVGHTASHGFAAGWSEPIRVTTPGPWTFSWQAAIHSTGARWTLAILVVPA